MVKSTIDDIKDITLERQIRKLAGVIDKQNEVISSVGNVDARITAVEDSTANNTVQINSVKEDVSKNTIAIGNISNRVTNVEQSTEAIPGIQTEINGINNSLVSNVTASFDNPSRTLMISVGREASPSIDATVVIPASSETGQYSEGNGITIQNYQIAVDTNVVALKTDIPVVPDVSGLTQRVQTLETEMPTKASVDSVNALESTVNSNTQNITTLTESVNGKVAIAQGVENSGKVLGIGADGNVTPVNAGGSSGGGDGWKEVDLSNFPTDWTVGDRVKIVFSVSATFIQASWASQKPAFNSFDNASFPTGEVEFELLAGTVGSGSPFRVNSESDYISILTLFEINGAENWNTSNNIFTIQAIGFNGSGKSTSTLNFNKNNMSGKIYKIYRIKTST